MATVDRPRSKKRVSADHLESPRRPLRAFRYGCYVTLLALVAALYFAPAIVAHTPLASWGLASALQLDGTVSLGSTSLGWFSCVTAENVEIRDRAGGKVLEVASLSTEKPLIALLLDYSDLGAIHVERPVLHVVAEETDSNLEQVFAGLLAGEGGTQVTLELKVTGATIVVDDVPARRKFRVDNLTIDGKFAGDNTLAMAVSGAVVDERQPASFKIELQTKGPAAEATASGKIDCQTSALPLELVEPVLRRYVERAQLAGRLSTRLAGAWGEFAERGETSLRGESLVTGLSFSAAALSSDRIELDRIEIPCHIVGQGDVVQIEQLGINCELGQVSISGSAKMSDFTADDKFHSLARENYELKGHVDLAQLARRLPHTLRIREGTEITSGDIELILSSRQQPEGMIWTGSVEAKQLGAQADGRALNWANPLSIQLATRETKDGLVLDRAACTSSFLQLDASGSIDDLTASASFDLARLAAELRQFSDLGGAQWAGSGQARLDWKRLANDAFAAHGEFQAKGFQFVAAGGQAWKEDSVVARLDLGGQLKDRSIGRVERAELSVEAGGDRLQARLQEPVAEPATAAWPVQCSWHGQLAAWSPRLESCLGLAGWDLGGAAALQANMRCSSQTVEIAQAKADFTQFRAAGHGWFISEPAVSIAVNGGWDLAKSRIEVAQCQLTAGGTSTTISQAVLQSAASGWVIDGGTAQWAADLAQWYRWQHDPRTPAEWQVAGRLGGEAQWKHERGVTTGRVDAAIDQLHLAELTPAKNGAAPAVWRERQITLVGKGTYRHDAGFLELDKAQIASDALQCNAEGTIPLSEQGGNIDLKGTVQFDWAQLTPLWRPYLGQGAQIEGRQARAFAMRGRLTGTPSDSQSWRQVTAEAAVGWSSMDLYGLRVGPGEVAANLADGQLRGKPMDVQVSQGRFTFTPFARLTPAPAELLQIPQGPLLTDIHLSPEMCARGLKFVAPILAESTVAEGRFSISLDGGRIPLADPGAGDTSGKMAMRAQVKAGPVAQEFMVLVNEISSILQRGTLVTRNDQAAALLSIDASDVEFRLVNRRVYHRGLKFMAGTLPIITHGSVGLDETLSLVAEVPIQAKLFGRDLSLGALEGQTLQIPIDGTLKKPKLDHRIVERLATQLLQNATRGVLIDEVNKQLDRLLPFPKQ